MSYLVRTPSSRSPVPVLASSRHVRTRDHAHAHASTVPESPAAAPPRFAVVVSRWCMAVGGGICHPQGACGRQNRSYRLKDGGVAGVAYFAGALVAAGVVVAAVGNRIVGLGYTAADRGCDVGVPFGANFQPRTVMAECCQRRMVMVELRTRQLRGALPYGVRGPEAGLAAVAVCSNVRTFVNDQIVEADWVHDRVAGVRGNSALRLVAGSYVVSGASPSNEIGV